MITLDVETTYSDTAHYKNPMSHCYMIGIRDYDNWYDVAWKPSEIYRVNNALVNCDILVGHNLKFDIQWCLSIGLELPDDIKLWDTQTVEYILSGQSSTWPSLNDLAKEYNYEQKLDVVKTEYWEKGIDTKDVPWEILKKYCLYDCELTQNIALDQMKLAEELGLMPLIELHMEDYKILTLAEFKGLKFDYNESQAQAEKTLQLRNEIEKQIKGFCPIDINLGSPQQLSALLYGGEIKEVVKVPDGIYGPKAQKAGQIRFKNTEVIHKLPRLYKPLPNTETATKGVWSTDESTLIKLGGSGLINLIQQLRKLDKELNTYFLGLMNKINDFNWSKDRIYGKFNTCATRTGRLSSSEPNLQNMSVGAQRIIVSSYAN